MKFNTIEELVKSIDDTDGPLEWLVKYTDIVPEDMKLIQALPLAWSYASKEIVNVCLDICNNSSI